MILSSLASMLASRASAVALAAWPSVVAVPVVAEAAGTVVGAGAADAATGFRAAAPPLKAFLMAAAADEGGAAAAAAADDEVGAADAPRLVRTAVLLVFRSFALAI